MQLNAEWLYFNSKKRTTFFYTLKNFYFLSCCLSLLSLIFSTKIFQIGLWVQAESIQLVLILSSLFQIISLLCMSFYFPRLIKRIFSQPLILLAGLFALWSALVSLFSGYPHLSWLGYPEMPEGGANYFNFFILLISFLFFQRSKLRHYFIFSIFLILTYALYSFYFLKNNDNFSLFHFSDYIAFYIIFALGALSSYIKNNKILFFIFILGTCLMYLTGNRSALGLWIILPFFILTFEFIRKKITKKCNDYYLFVNYFFINSFYLIFFIAFYHINFIGAALRSLRGRYLMHWSSMQELWNNPKIFIFGKGYGSFKDLYFNHYPLGFFGTHVQAFWNEFIAASIHSHNQLIEICLSTGIIGLILFLFMFNALIKSLKVPLYIGLFFIGIYFALNSLWFMVHSALPSLALMMTFFYAMKHKTFNFLKNRIYILSILFFTLGISIYSLSLSIHYAHQIKELNQGKITLHNIHDEKMGYVYSANIIHQNAKIIENSIYQKIPLEALPKNVLLSEEQEALFYKDFDKKPTFYQVLFLNYLNQYLHKYQNENQPLDILLNNFKKFYLTLIRKNTSREEFIFYYFQMLELNKKYTILSELSEEVLKLKPHSPVGLWGKAKATEAKGNLKESHRIMKEAYESGITYLIK
jgi:hypothetical protein